MLAMVEYEKKSFEARKKMARVNGIPYGWLRAGIFIDK